VRQKIHNLASVTINDVGINKFGINWIKWYNFYKLESFKQKWYNYINLNRLTNWCISFLVNINYKNNTKFTSVTSDSNKNYINDSLPKIIFSHSNVTVVP